MDNGQLGVRGEGLGVRGEALVSSRDLSPLTPNPSPLTPSSERLALWTLVVLYLACACGFTLATPYGEAPDEGGHFLYIEYLVRFGKLPDIGKRFYSPESFQAPLYYSLGAAIVFTTRKISGADMRKPLGPVLLDNPRSSSTGSGGFNVMLHPANERWPLWPYAFRVMSILMGLGVVLFTYATARALVPAPAPAVVPLTATAFAALIPQANFIRASISNENLADLIGAWIIWLLVSHLTRPYSPRRVIWLGVAFGLGLLAKLSLALFVLPILWVLCRFWILDFGFLIGVSSKIQNPKSKIQNVLKDFLAFAAPTVALAGWFYAYRWVVYGDPLATNAWHAMIPPDNTFRLSDLFWFQEPFRGFLWTSFWANYGWQKIWMPGWTYNVFLAVTLLAVVGGAYLLIRRALTPAQRASCAVMVSALLLMYVLVVQASTYVVAWQGRLMYSALSSACVLLGLGLGALVLGRGAVQPAPLTPGRRRLGAGLVLCVAAGLLAANVYSIFWLVLPGLNGG